ncbi:MAG: virulence RhuM family protein [Fibrobacter sp.]|nr:virulence RhuM family protein [Fibrobacter sp.]
MNENEEKGEIVLYQPEGEVRLEVRVENETVWLTQAQIADLFGTKRPAITKHLKNIYASQELDESSTCSILEHMGKDSKQVYETKYYNLDAILSIGYRVNSKNATLFRRWANKILKEYMLKGYAVNQRMVATGMQIANQFQEQRQLIEKQGSKLENVNTRLSTVEKHIDFFVKAAQTPTGGILATGTRFDGLVLIADLVKSAKQSVVFIDPYANIEVLKFAAMRAKNIKAVIYSARITPEFKAAKDMHNKQHPGLELKTMRTIHDRFLLIDDTVYHFGASFKDMGNEMTAFSILNFVTPEEVIAKIQASMKGK